MSETTLITDTAATTTEGQPAAGAEEAAEASTTAAANPAQQQQTEGGNADGDKTADGGEGGEKQDEPKGAPEKYEFTAPEGKAYDPQVLGKFEELARKHNLTQEAAQELLSEVGPMIDARQSEQIEALHSEWQSASVADKEFGGEKLQENLATAKKALDAFGSPELQTLLKSSGLGNHPEVIRFMYRAGKAISEDTFVPGSRQPADTAKRMYPNSNMN